MKIRYERLNLKVSTTRLDYILSYVIDAMFFLVEYISKYTEKYRIQNTFPFISITKNNEVF